ncbi:hypothetical protein C0995_000070 [Termitomyces sp. Mi166|nr:hypothetical protein C0995_000070 [Termitomyces sp. Mi166\
MEDPGIHDEVIPGSDEEENSLVAQISCQNDRALLEDRILPATTQDTIRTPFDATSLKRSPISTISNGTTSSSSITNPRPKPRPLKKRTDMSSSDTSHPEETATISDVFLDTDFSMSTAERAKIRSRNNKSRTQQPTLPASDIIELSSDDDDDDFNILPPKRRKTTDKTKTKSVKKSKTNSELVDTARPKPRPRPRPLKKQNKGENAEQTSPIGALTQDNPISTSPISNDILTVPWQLPPSDPPSSIASSYDHPPITILHQVSTDHDPSSSPLFSSGKRNRKLAMLNVDELESDTDLLAGDVINVDTRLMPPPPLPGPPPTFFVGSSSVHDDRPPATSTTSGTKAHAVKKSRKKKLVDNEDEDNGVLGTSKHKAKAKQKTPAKKVEVVVKQPKAKGKGKEKEIFKSWESIDDDDDDDPSDKVPATASTTLKKPESLTSLSSVLECNNDNSAKAKSSKKRKSVDREDDELDTIGRTTGSSEYKRRAVGRGKRVIDSDNEDVSLPVNEATSTPKAKAKNQDKPFPDQTASKSSPCANGESNDATSSKQQTSDEKEPQDDASSKENVRPPPTSDIPRTPQASVGPGVSRIPSLSSRYTVAPKMKSTPMSDLIRRVNSKPGSPFCSPAPRSGGASSATPGTAYSPYAKASRTALSRIAPLHPNRRTPPLPPPPLPPKKKTKKELQREEQWEEELIESVGGITEWACMSDTERAEMRRTKREKEMYGWED